MRRGCTRDCGAEGDQIPYSTQNHNEKAVLEGMAEMSEKFKAMGNEVYVESRRGEGEQ